MAANRNEAYEFDKGCFLKLNQKAKLQTEETKFGKPKTEKLN